MKTFARSVVLIFVFLGSVSAQDLDIVFALEMSAGTEQAIGLIRPRVLRDSDRAAVIGFTRSAQVLQPLTDSREDLAAALRRAGARFAVGIGKGGMGQRVANTPVDITGALNRACAEFGDGRRTDRKRAILLFFAGEDPKLGAQIDPLTVRLRADGVRLFAVAIQKVPEPAIARGPNRIDYPFPVMTAQFLSRLIGESGGRMFQGNWDLSRILADARKP